MTRKPLTMFALRLRRSRLNSTLGGKPVRQVDAARLCGVSPATYHRWETSVTYPMPQMMPTVARVMGIDEDEVWLDIGHIPPDMLHFLTMTREGTQTVKNIRRIMDVFEQNQKPTTRRDAPIAEKFNDRYLNKYRKTADANHRRRREKLREAGEVLPEDVDPSLAIETETTSETP